MTNTQDALLGKRLDGRYEIESLVGVGGMANVYRARDLRSGKTVAVKVLREEFCGNEELVHRFKNESKAISVLDHPNIVKVLDISVTEKLNYIVMEYIDGITLKEYMNQRGGPLTWKETIHFATQILAALQHAHERGVVHRDVKPQNIMLLTDGSIKMMDFGIARFSREQRFVESEATMGSVHYISPEQASGGETGTATDLYSVGVMMYEMLSGRLPFENEDAMKVAINQITGEPPDLAKLAPDTPPGLVAITKHAMAKNVAARYQSTAAMLADIQKFKRDPDIRFEYTYMTGDSPDKVIGQVMNANRQTKSSRSSAAAEKRRTAQEPRREKRAGASKAAKPKKKRVTFIKVLLVFTALFVGVCLYLCYYTFSNSTNVLFSTRKDVALADYEGMTRAQVESDPNAALLNIVYDEQYNSTFEAGVIFGQTPKGNRTVKEGQKVTLKVSLGTEYLDVPNVSGYLQEDAQAALKGAGLSVSVRPDYSSEVAVGTVVSTDPVAGTQVASGTTVILYVSKEKIDITRTVPSLVGMPLEDARRALKDSGLILGAYVENFSDYPPGTVFEQSVPPGTSVRVYSSITVGLSLGPIPVVETPVPEQNWEENWEENNGENNDG